MPRQARTESGTGIYHVMLRGINRQDIFEEKEDYVRMLSCLQQMLEQYDDQGNRQPPLCTFYAYCLMSNHVHLLLRVNQEDIGSTIKHLAVMYAIYYNQKYSRSGHLFQDRFKSEPVNDMAYFVTLLRYIHQNRRTKQEQRPSSLGLCLARRRKTTVNPTKAGIVSKVGDYDWSSWKEYTGEVPDAACLCATNATLKRMPLEDLRELVEVPLEDDVQCLELDETVKVSVGDSEVRQHLLEQYSISDPIKVQELEKEQRTDARSKSRVKLASTMPCEKEEDQRSNKIIISCLELGTGLRQLSRLTGVTYGVINKLNKKHLKK